MANLATISVANDNGESIRVIANIGDQPPRVRPETTVDVAETKPPEGWATQRLPALIFFVIATGLAILSTVQGMAPIETGTLSAVSAISALCLLFALPNDRQFLRGGLAVCSGLFACVAAALVLPAYDLWPTSAEITIFAGVYLAIAAVTRSRLCVAVALGLLTAQLIDTNGLFGLPPMTQNMMFGLLLGAVGVAIYAGSRSMASAAVLALAVAGLSLLAMVGLPVASALAILAILGAAAALTLRSLLRSGHVAADAPMVGAAIVAGASAIALQLVLTTDTGVDTVLFSEAAPNWAFPLLVLAQGTAAVFTIKDGAQRHANWIEVALYQLAFVAAITVTLFPGQFQELTAYAATTALVALFAASLIAASLLCLFRSWRSDSPILSSLSVLFLMAQVLVGVRYVQGDFDLGVAGMVCAGVAFSLAVIMAIAPKRITKEPVALSEKPTAELVS